MARGMMSAFACELAMKAVSLTVNDAARKTHDLLCLYDHLPKSSKQRLEFDFPDIRGGVDMKAQRDVTTEIRRRRTTNTALR